jgi:hypothetical protein
VPLFQEKKKTRELREPNGRRIFFRHLRGDHALGSKNYYLFTFIMRFVNE